MIVGDSETILRLNDLVERISEVDSTVLISGESGIGKELVAKTIHRLSARKNKSFIAINCGAIPPTLMESELFGYEKGAFTGAARQGKQGLFEMAQNGTIFLDEISDLPLNTQVKILRVLQEREITRVGGTTSIPIDVRVIAATNVSLYDRVASGEFRKDLFYRLNVIPINIPPLRSHKEDIPVLINHFLHQFNTKFQKNMSVSPQALSKMMAYNWPGNVRELENFIERMVVLNGRSTIGLEDLPVEFQQVKITKINSLREAVEEFEKELISKALAECASVALAAQQLGVDRTTISKKMKKYGLELHRD